jgi:hypothetical protein
VLCLILATGGRSQNRVKQRFAACLPCIEREEKWRWPPASESELCQGHDADLMLVSLLNGADLAFEDERGIGFACRGGGLKLLCVCFGMGEMTTKRRRASISFPS